MPNYFLSKDSYVCENEGYVVFLDLRKDRYLALPPDSAFRFRSLVTELDRDIPSDDEDGGLARVLESKGLLVRDPSRGKAVNKVSIDIPTESLRTVLQAQPYLRARYLYDFAASWLSASVMLRWIPLHRIVNRVRARKEKAGAATGSIGAGGVDRMAGIFNLIQPIFYASDNACLRNSLTLIEFLARYDIYATWVFGVKLGPFAAHCWVQDGGTVLNDTAEHAREFTPLMSI